MPLDPKDFGFHAASERRTPQRDKPTVRFKADKLVIRAFLDRLPLEGKKLSSSGRRLDGNWMGGRGIASWDNKNNLITPDLGSKAADSVQKQVKKLYIERVNIALRNLGAQRK